MMKRSLFWITVVSFCLWLCGCYNDALDPTQLGRFEPTPSVNVILDTLGVADEPIPTYEGAEEPRPEDLVPYQPDYVFSSGDIIRISIFELRQEGIAYVDQLIITESGHLSIPDVGIVKAAGLTETELEREIISILSPSIIKDPSVTVTLLSSERRFFSIVGQGVAQNARFRMPRYPIRLLDALALAGGPGDFNVSYVYVSRDVDAQDMQTFEIEPEADVIQPTEGKPKNIEDQMLEMITPSNHQKLNGILVTSAEMATYRELEALASPEGIEPVEEMFDPTEELESVLPEEPASRIEWVFEDGAWKPVEVKTGAPEPSGFQPEVLKPEQYGEIDRTPVQPQPQIPSDFGLSDIGSADTVTRVIKIPLDRLLSGDPRYNIVIQPADRITVPRDLVGEFWVAGNVNAPNAYSIVGRPITLKQAITTAGGLNAIAWPKKVEVIRRIGKNKAGLMQEEIVLVDLEKIAKGLQPDFFIKPYDYINVGTHGTSRWLAVLRNAFRATYGFGLIYDRNFADRDFGRDPLPDIF